MQSFENIVGKGDITVMSNFSLYHSVFNLFVELSACSSNLKLSSAKFFNLEKFKICCLGNH